MKLTIFVVGPTQSGKTAIANILADLLESTSAQYYPTQGVRILEIEKSITVLDGKKGRAREENIQVELWDTSSDEKLVPSRSSCIILVNL
ncbi:hypothetical protein SmJEL517_g00329 [Synchytrium microbalum]|uniref:G domain-containing protein n=1 Tax=Synchytrium microbalum TaxID=1806994 RepID=A0A507CKH5_9FUNG|nr:uncharacterized protein SmJEL517_g00329 [Synchytrium microbalum]TPX38333.1 hypothetical protein SmJEL517_g00329 [Synchytrium microbalum]